MTCRAVIDLCKRPDEVRKVGFDLTDFCTRFHNPATIYEEDEAVRPRPKREDPDGRGASGFEFVAQSDGMTSDTVPRLIGPAGKQITDGDIVWLARSVSVASLTRNVQSVVWGAEAGMTVASFVIDNAGGKVKISALHSGGTAGNTYRVSALVTFSDGSVEEFAIDWEIKAD